LSAWVRVVMSCAECPDDGDRSKELYPPKKVYSPKPRIPIVTMLLSDCYAVLSAGGNLDIFVLGSVSVFEMRKYFGG